MRDYLDEVMKGPLPSNERDLGWPEAAAVNRLSEPVRASMKRPIRSMRAALGLLAVVLPTHANLSTPISGEELVALVSGRSLALSWYGNLSNPALMMVWDFRKDGSVCARTGASKAGDKCLDEGRWTVKDSVFCWELTWFGESFGVKSTCSTVWRVGPQRIELRSVKTPELTGIAAKPL
jgi:hypothetical protein